MIAIEPGCIIHACTIENGAFVGVGSRVLDGAVVGSQAMISPGSLVTQNTVVGAKQVISPFSLLPFFFLLLYDALSCFCI